MSCEVGQQQDIQPAVLLLVSMFETRILAVHPAAFSPADLEILRGTKLWFPARTLCKGRRQDAPDAHRCYRSRGAAWTGT